MPTPDKMNAGGFMRLSVGFYLAFVALLATVLVVILSYLGPLPPDTVVMTTGPLGEASDTFGQHYKELLAQQGVELNLLPSAGSVENLKRLNDPNSGVSAGFVLGGLTSEQLSPDLVSLGTLFYEPLWFFYKGEEPGLRLEGLYGRKLSIGPEGSGSRVMALELLERNGLKPRFAQLLPLTSAEATEELLRGKIGAVIMMASWDSPFVRRLIADPQVELWNYLRPDAYVALYPSLSKLVLPAGVGNMADNRPPVDTNLIAPKASLIVRDDLHPAIKYLLLDAATEIHSGPGVFQKSGQFPAPERDDLPLSSEARQFYKSGRPFLQRYLPFELAALSVKLLVLLIPLVGVLYPLLRFVPGIYGWSMRQRIFRLYGEVKVIEIELEKSPSMSPTELIARLDRLEDRAIHMRAPLTFAHLIYDLRIHIKLVRERLQQLASDPPEN